MQLHQMMEQNAEEPRRKVKMVRVVAPRVAIVTGMGSVALSSVTCHLYHLIIESYCSQAPSEASTAQSY